MNGQSTYGNSNSQTVTGIQDPCGHQPGEHHRLLAVVW